LLWWQLRGAAFCGRNERFQRLFKIETLRLKKVSSSSKDLFKRKVKSKGKGEGKSKGRQGEVERCVSA